jgi:hypothetical protein
MLDLQKIGADMKSTVKQSTKGVGITIISIMLLAGCATVKATKTANLPSNAKLLVMPPHDVVQGGLPHPVGKGSGRQLQKAVHRELNAISDYDIVVFEANDRLNHTTVVKKEDAIVESTKLGVDYCLLLTLGEFRNAAPMTFRTDFVTMHSGALIDVNTKKEVWSLDRPFMLEKSNIGNHYCLIDNIAKAIAESIVKQ